MAQVETMTNLPASFEATVRMVQKGDDSYPTWAYFQASQADRDAVDHYLVTINHPLA